MCVKYFKKNYIIIQPLIFCANQKMTALHYAVYFGWTKVIEVLLANGANLTAINHQNHNDGLSTCTITILSLAVLGKRLDAAKLLLKHGANLEDLNLQHENAIHAVCGSNSNDCMCINREFLLLLGLP